MRMIEQVLSSKHHLALRWPHYLLDSVLACAGSLLVTAVIGVFQLYPRIPNISIIYLLIVQALATTRGRYAAILAALVAFLSFNFFVVPPLHTFVLYRIEEWIALFVFLITALLTSQLAGALRERAEQASRRERETHLLYDLVRVTNREETPTRQLEAIARAMVDVLAIFGVKECTVLQPDALGTLRIQASTSQMEKPVALSADEQVGAAWTLAHGRSMTLYEEAEFAPSASANGKRPEARSAHRRSVCLLPLHIGAKGIGVLSLRLREGTGRFPQEERQDGQSVSARAHPSFFWTFLDQATALVERARLQQETVRMAVLERTDALRTALLSSVSHDLRTPLTAMKAAASSLLQREVQWDDEARQGFAQTIVHEANRLDRLVGNLLDMSRIEEGALKPHKEEYALVALIHDVLDRLDPLLTGRVVEMHLPDELLLVEIDYLHMDQVLTNLLENAVRHTPAGTPVQVCAQSEGEAIVLSVADRGPGIPQAELERVFDKFYRVLRERHSSDPSPGAPPGGSGLGLAVCRGLVEAHGGRIWATPREGGGVVMSVALPGLKSERRET